MTTQPLPRSLGFLSSVRATPRSTQRALQPARLHGIDDPPDGVIIDVPPWGLVVPAEAVEQGVRYHASVETGSIPGGATVTLHWEHKDGSYTQQISDEYDGSGEFVVFRIPPEWLKASIGAPVTLYYEVMSGEGAPAIGPAVDIDMAPPLEIHPIQIEELAYGEPLDPTQFPVGIYVVVERVLSARPYHSFSLAINVMGEAEDGTESVLKIFRKTLDEVAEAPERFFVPAVLYTGLYSGDVVRARIECTVQTFLTPVPQNDWYHQWRVGVIDVLDTGD